MAIHLPLAKLSQWQQTAFCCALLERMLPNYAMFSQAADFGDIKVLRNQLDLIWQRLDKNQKVKINYDAQLGKLEEQTPNPELFDFFGVFPALDVCMSLMSLLQAMQSSEGNEYNQVSKLSENSVSYYVELLLVDEAGEEQTHTSGELVIDEQAIDEHPLMVWEIETQNELFDFLQNAPESKNTCIQAKKMVLEEGISNLGIEI